MAQKADECLEIPREPFSLAQRDLPSSFHPDVGSQNTCALWPPECPGDRLCPSHCGCVWGWFVWGPFVIRRSFLVFLWDAFDWLAASAWSQVSGAHQGWGPENELSSRMAVASLKCAQCLLVSAEFSSVASGWLWVWFDGGALCGACLVKVCHELRLNHWSQEVLLISADKSVTDRFTPLVLGAGDVHVLIFGHRNGSLDRFSVGAMGCYYVYRLLVPGEPSFHLENLTCCFMMVSGCFWPAYNEHKHAWKLAQKDCSENLPQVLISLRNKGSDLATDTDHNS